MAKIFPSILKPLKRLDRAAWPRVLLAVFENVFGDLAPREPAKDANTRSSWPLELVEVNSQDRRISKHRDRDLLT
jgi:hypothetical protein